MAPTAINAGDMSQVPIVDMFEACCKDLLSLRPSRARPKMVRRVAAAGGEDGQVVEGVGHIGVVCTERLFADHHHALEEPVSVGVLALFAVHLSQAVEGGGHIGVFGAEHLLENRQRSLGEPLGVGVPTLLAVHLGQVTEGGSQTGVFGAERLLLDRQRPLE